MMVGKERLIQKYRTEQPFHSLVKSFVQLMHNGISRSEFAQAAAFAQEVYLEEIDELHDHLDPNVTYGDCKGCITLGRVNAPRAKESE